MITTVTSKDVSGDFAWVLATLRVVKQMFIVDDDGNKVAVLLSPERHRQLIDIEVAEGWATIDALRRRNADLDPDEVLRDVTEIVQQVRQERSEEQC